MRITAHNFLMRSATDLGEILFLMGMSTGLCHGFDDKFPACTCRHIYMCIYIYIYSTPPKTHILRENYVHLHVPLTKHSCTSLWNLYFPTS